MELFRWRAEHDHTGRPLAERMRPKSLERYVGQAHLLAPGKFLAQALEQKRLPSLIFWGPPGCGKTTLARLLAHSIQAEWITLSAVNAGVKELREVIGRATEQRHAYGRQTMLFIDEIHRFNKAQQDALLPSVEEGTITLIGATTENPSFEMNSALLSRMRVLRLHPLDDEAIVSVLTQALDTDEELQKRKLLLDEGQLLTIAYAAAGDARKALSVLDSLLALSDPQQSPTIITQEQLAQALSGQTLRYDRAGEEHYDVASAMIKSLRGSDPDASVYWLCRMIEGGEDPLFVARRLVIFASEDIGNADPQALDVAINTFHAVHVIGLPEGRLPLTQAVLYLAAAPKSNSTLTTYQRAQEDVKRHGSLAVPLHLRNAPTLLMKAEHYSDGYKYPHDFGGHVAQQYLPDALSHRRYYEPKKSGFEAELAQRLERIQDRGVSKKK